MLRVVSRANESDVEARVAMEAKSALLTLFKASVEYLRILLAGSRAFDLGSELILESFGLHGGKLLSFLLLHRELLLLLHSSALRVRVTAIPTNRVSQCCPLSKEQDRSEKRV